MFVSITRDPIDPAAVLARVGRPEDGAAVLFLGTIRNHNEGRRVVGLRYEAYAEMAERLLAEIGGEAVERWLGDDLGDDEETAGRIAVVHRVGDLGIGDIGVAVAASAPHRAESFAACRYVIDELKERVPIWKRERYAEGTEEWLEGTVPTPSEAARE